MCNGSAEDGFNKNPVFDAWKNEDASYSLGEDYTILTKGFIWNSYD